MVKIALDPNMYYAQMSTADTLRKARELGFDYVELSPNEEFHFWHRYPKADDDFVSDMKKAVRETGVEISTLNPVFNWSAVDEQERQDLIPMRAIPHGLSIPGTAHTWRSWTINFRCSSLTGRRWINGHKTLASSWLGSCTRTTLFSRRNSS